MTIYQAIPAIMAEIGAISKDRTNTGQGYKFRGIDDVYNAVHGLLIKYKVFTAPEVIEAKDESVTTAKGSVLFYARLLIKYTFYAEDGSSFVVTVRGEGMDSGDKASNKAMAVAHKYAFIQVFAIPTENGDDPENESHEVVATAKPADGPSLGDRIKRLNAVLVAANRKAFSEAISAATNAQEQLEVVKAWEAKLTTSRGAPAPKKEQEEIF